MFKCKTILFVPICLSIIASAIACYAEEDYEDLVDITEANGKIYGFAASGASSSLDLKARETIQWSDSKGLLGAFLSNFRFFVISDTSKTWQVYPLRSNEAEDSVTSLSATVALLVTDGRAIAFDGKDNRFVDTQIPIRDDVVVAKTGDHIAVVVTSTRAFAMASGSTDFAEISLKLNESIGAIKITSSKATVTTSDRLLIFVAQSGVWRKHRLD